MIKNIILTSLVLCLSWSSGLAQENLFDSNTIPDNLKENANAVIRKNDVVITIEEFDEVEVVTERIVTVLNKKGLGDINALESYDGTSRIKKMEVVIYDAFGKKIAKFKIDDFKDVSAVSNGTLYSDSKVKYLDYTPRDYPFTVHYKSVVENLSTAFLPTWVPLEYFYASTQSSSFKVVNKSEAVIKVKESNLENYSILKNGELDYSATNLTALEQQSYSPGFTTYGPMVKIALKRFRMKGVEGINNDWNDFGQWMNDKLMSDVGALPDVVKQEIKGLTKDASSDREKAKIVYKFMQDRSRYISVQVGIGGWKPIDAISVHEKAYGDCKGLTNYTKALLKEVGIESHHVVIYGGRNIRSLDNEFSSTQGNHMILYIPELDEEKDIWLECTSKTSPFGYIAGFTDDRDALVLTNEGGKIMHTTIYDTEENLQKSIAQITVDKDGSAAASIEMTTEGYQYSFRDHLNKESKKDLFKIYNNYWSHLNGLTILEAQVENNKEEIKVVEKASMTVSRYGSKTGNLLLMQPVFFNRNESEPPRYKDRYTDFEIDRGYLDIDEYEITLEKGLTLDAIPENISIDTKFGNYKLEITDLGQGKLRVYRSLKINKGYFPKEDYEFYRDFRADLVKHDASKLVLKIS